MDELDEMLIEIKNMIFDLGTGVQVDLDELIALIEDYGVANQNYIRYRE